MAEVNFVIGELLQLQQDWQIAVTKVKDRFQNPTDGGWADLLVNFVFIDDPNLHICELQVCHKDLLAVRKHMGGHEQYSEFRAISEIFEHLELPLGSRGPGSQD